MGSLNKVILIGNIGKAPEIKSTAAGKNYARFSLATSESWKDKNTGTKKTNTTWHYITAFAPLAEVCQKYVHKGSQIYVEGFLKNHVYEKDGQKRTNTEIIANSILLLDKKQNKENHGNYADKDNFY